MVIERIARELFDAVLPSRVTIRGALFGEASGTRLHAEVLGVGVPSMAAAPQDGIPTAPTYLWLQEHRTILVQPDCREDPLPPPMLTERYGVGAQMLGPLLRDGKLIGSISVHQEGGPRSWTTDDITALNAALAEMTEVIQM